MAIEELLAQNLEVNKQILSALSQQGYDRALQLGQLTPFDVRPFDITSAITAQRVVFPPCRYIQATTDGLSLEGITVRLGTQSAPAIPLSQVDVLAVGSATELYLTADVRAGRSTLTLYFVRTEPLNLHLGGDISLAENAARLGSINTFDRRGEVIFQDGFEDGLSRWLIETSGAASGVTLSNAYVKRGSISAKLATGGTANNSATVRRSLPYSANGKFGLEASVMFASGDACYVYIYFTVFDGTLQRSGIIHFRPNTSVISVTHGTGATVANFATGLSIYTSTNYPLFHTLKLVADFANLKYVRFLWNSNFYNISMYDLYSVASVTSPYINFYIQYVTTENAIKNAYIDDIIVTQNEP